MKMTCCSLKVLSYISATVQLIFCIFSFALVLTAVIISQVDKERDEDYEYNERPVQTFVIVILVLCLVGTALLIALIVGMKQNRLILVRIYVYTNCVLLVLSILGIIIDFIQNLIHLDEAAGRAFLNLLWISLIVGLAVIFFIPIFIYHQRMSATPILPTSYNPPVVKVNREF